MEGPLNHLFHSFVIAVILFIIMRFGLGQSMNMSLNRSLVIGALAFIYMVFFGHGLPTHINRI